MKIFSFLLFFWSTVSFAGVDEPQGCWAKKTTPCAFRADHSEWVTYGETRIRVARGTSFLLKAENQWQLLDGDVWLETSGPVIFVQGNRQFFVDGHAWLKKDKERFEIQSFQGETKIQGTFASDVLPAGFKNWWELSTQGLMQPMEMKSTLADWNRLTNYESDQAAEKIKNYRELWKSRVEMSSEFYASLTQKRRDQIESRQDNAHQRLLDKKAEQQMLRQMFRDRYSER